MKDDTSTPITEGSAPNEFEQGKPGTNARSEAEAAIEDLRQRGGVFVNAVRATRMPMALTDPNLPGNPIVFANSSFLKLSGYGMDEVLGQQPHFMNGPGTDPSDAKRFEEAIRSDQDDIIETVQYRKDGSRFVATVLISAFKDERGRTLNHFMSWLDVTRRVEAEEEVSELRTIQNALRASEARYRGLLNTIDEGFCIVEVQFDDAKRPTDYTFLEINAAFERQTGIEEAVGKRMREIAPDHEQHWFDIYGRIALTGVPERFEQPAEALGRYYDVYAFRVGAPGENQVGILFNDVSERRRAEEALSESEAKYCSLFQAMDEGYLLAEVIRDERTGLTDIHYLEANPAAIRIAGREFTGLRMREIDPDYEEFWYELYDRVAATGESSRGEHYAAPHERWFAFYVFKVGDERSRRVASIFQDITDRKREERLLRESEERQAFLLKLTDALRPIHEAREIQATTARMVAEHLKADRAMYAEVEGDPGEETGFLRGQYVRPGGEGDATAPFPERFTYGQFGQHTMEARYRGEPLIVADVQNDPAYSEDERAVWAQYGVRAAVVATLPKGGRLVAEFGVHSATARRWTEGEISLIKEVGERTWAAAERARAEQALRASEAKYRTLFESIDEGFCIVEILFDPEGKPFDILHLEANDAYQRQTGLSDIVGKRAREIIQDGGPWLDFYANVALTGEPARLEAFLGPDLNRWISSYASRIGGEGSRKVAIVFNDITERKLAEDAVRESQELLSAVLEVLPVGVGLINTEGDYVILNEAMRRFLPTGRMPSRDPDRAWRWRGWDEEGRLLEPDNFPGARSFRGDTVVPGIEMLCTLDDDSEVWTTVSALPLRGPDGAITSILNVVTDIDALKRAAEALGETQRQAMLLLSELQHRVRNTLAVVRSIARRTAENTLTSEEMLSHFQGRLDAFSRVQSALTRSADAKVSITSLIEDELVAHAARDGEQVRIEGPEIGLDGRTAERLSLAIHELTTNAVKHGALTDGSGRIHVRWSVKGPAANLRLSLSWKESGIEIDETPMREGFGMELLLRSLPYDLEAETTVELKSGGLEFNLDMPLPDPTEIH